MSRRTDTLAGCDAAARIASRNLPSHYRLHVALMRLAELAESPVVRKRARNRLRGGARNGGTW